MNLHRDDTPLIEAATMFSAGPQVPNAPCATEWQEPPALSLGEQGLIQDCSKSLETLFGFRRSELVWQHVSKLFPQLADVELVQAGQVNAMLNYSCRCGRIYQARNRDGDCFPSNLSIVRLAYAGKNFLRVIVRPAPAVAA